MYSLTINKSVKDLDLLNEQRSLIHTGKLLRQPDSGSETSGWKELFVLLFDNYRMLYIYFMGPFLMIVTVVLTSQEPQQDNTTKYPVYRRVSLIISISFVFPIVCLLANPFGATHLGQFY